MQISRVGGLVDKTGTYQVKGRKAGAWALLFFFCCIVAEGVVPSSTVCAQFLCPPYKLTEFGMHSCYVHEGRGRESVVSRMGLMQEQHTVYQQICSLRSPQICVKTYIKHPSLNNNFFLTVFPHTKKILLKYLNLHRFLLPQRKSQNL